MSEISGSAGGTAARRLRLGMVGGGQDAFIGAVHRIAARLDDRYELVAGALSSDPARAKASAVDLHIAPARAYGSFAEMADKEAAREDGIDVVAIVTPNHVHHAACVPFIDAGIHIICDKPLTTTLADALDLVERVRRAGIVFALTHNYTGYPMVRQARAMIADGALGRIRVVQAEYSQDWLAARLEATGHKQAGWRTDPALAGPAGCVGDIGTHALNLATYVTGLELAAVSAELTTFVDGRRLDDNAGMLLRFNDGARGMLWSSQVAAGDENNLRLRVYGENGGMTWAQEHPNQLTFTRLGEKPQVLSRNSGTLSDAAGHASRIPAGHHEGYLEGFAVLYRDVAEQITARLEGRQPEPLACQVPTVEDGARGVKFIEAAVASSQQNGGWVDAKLPL